MSKVPSFVSQEPPTALLDPLLVLHRVPAAPRRTRHREVRPAPLRAHPTPGPLRAEVLLAALLGGDLPDLHDCVVAVQVLRVGVRGLSGVLDT